ncbi:MAG: CHRD domain-containing protein [Janthinobacterium lividum]
MKPIVTSALAAAAAILCTSASQAAPITYVAKLSGPAESPPNSSLGTGNAVIIIDTAANTLAVNVTFSGLTGTTTASHIHCCTAVPGVSTAIVATETPFFDSFPIGVTSGSYTHLFDLTAASSWNPAFITVSGGTIALAESNFASGVAAGAAYLNIHTSVVASGEIRGFLTVPVPEPAALAVVLTGLLGLGWRRTRPCSPPA